MATRPTVLITGCSDGGIGSALAHAFATLNYHVFASARNPLKMVSLSNKPNITLVTLDVTSDAQGAAALEQVRTITGGTLDYLINNAARNHWMPMVDESIEDVRAMFDVNVLGPLRMVKAFAPLVVAAKGTIVGITSISGRVNIPWMGTYAATKRSMELMAETLRLEMQPFDVRVLTIVTGAVQTNGMTYFDDWKLPASSMYKSVENVIYAKTHGDGRPEKQDTADEYAAKIMPMIVGGAKGSVWHPGWLNAFLRFAVGWLPTRVTDYMWSWGTGLDELAGHVSSNKT